MTCQNDLAYMSPTNCQQVVHVMWCTTWQTGSTTGCKCYGKVAIFTVTSHQHVGDLWESWQLVGCYRKVGDNRLLDNSASKVTTIWRYTNVSIIIIINKSTMTWGSYRKLLSWNLGFSQVPSLYELSVISGHRLLQARCPSCHTNNSVKSTDSTPGLIVSAYTPDS